MLDNLHTQATRAGLKMEFTKNYFPRFVDGKKGLEGFAKKYGIQVKDFRSAIAAENKRRRENRGTVFNIIVDGKQVLSTNNRKLANRIFKQRQARHGEASVQFVEDKDAPKKLPPLQPNSFEEEIFIQKIINQRFQGRGKPGPFKNRIIELMDDSDVDFYVTPSEALGRYITEMVTSIETAKFTGVLQPTISNEGGNVRVQYNPNSTVGRVVQALTNDPRFQNEVDQEKLYSTFPQIYNVLMDRTAREMPLLVGLRQYSYFNLLVEFTSTLSQLYDLPFIMYDNGFLPTLKSMIGDKRYKVQEFLDNDKLVEESFQSKDKGLASIISYGLTATGFKALDKIMKNTTMDANYNRYMKAAKAFNGDGTLKKQYENNKKFKKIQSEINLLLSDEITNPGENGRFWRAMKTPAEQRGQAENELIGSTLVQKLFINQPLTELRMPLVAKQIPNARMLYTMKSFMIVQLNTARNLAFNKIASGVRNGDFELFKEGMGALVKLMFFFMLMGMPIDLSKDVLSGRLGYVTDYMFNSGVRMLGINKYFLYKGQIEGYGDAFFDFFMPAPASTTVDAFNRFFDIMEQDGSLSEKVIKSRFMTTLPLYDTMHYVVPEMRKFKQQRQRKFMRKRMRQEGELFGSPDPFQKNYNLFGLPIEGRKPIPITREMLGI